jgi:ABC-type transport system involved in cytochrome bd biosynthesis fused ATPase/permease subunit
VLDAGQIVEIGTHDSLLAAGAAYARLYHAQHAQHAQIEARMKTTKDLAAAT